MHINKDFIAKLFTTHQDKKLFAPETLLVAVFVLLLVWILAVFLPVLWRLVQEITDAFSAYEKSRKFFPDDCLNNLTFQGKVVKTGIRSFRVTSSDSGALIKYHYWKDFFVSFEFNFEKFKESDEYRYEEVESKNKPKTEQITFKTKNNYFGFIFRAQDFDNYFMLVIGIKEALPRFKKQLWLIPHIRVDGKWDILSPKHYPDNRKTKLNETEPHIARIQVKDNSLKLSFDELKNDPFIWNLPTNYRINWPAQTKEIEGLEYVFGDQSIIDFRNKYGMIGFRCHGDEQVQISNLEITQL